MQWQNHSLIWWIMAAYGITWLNESNVLVNTGLWTSMEELQNYIRELRMSELTYDDAFRSPDLVKFSAAMRDLIL